MLMCAQGVVHGERRAAMRQSAPSPAARQCCAHQIHTLQSIVQALVDTLGAHIDTLPTQDLPAMLTIALSLELDLPAETMDAAALRIERDHHDFRGADDLLGAATALLQFRHARAVAGDGVMQRMAHCLTEVRSHDRNHKQRDRRFAAPAAADRSSFVTHARRRCCVGG